MDLFVNKILSYWEFWVGVIKIRCEWVVHWMTFWTHLNDFKNNFLPYTKSKDEVQCLDLHIRNWIVVLTLKNSSEFCVRSLENDLSSTMNLDQRLYLGSDDEADLVKELQSMCSSKSESDISKVSSTTGRTLNGSTQQQRDFLEPHPNSFPESAL